MGLLPLITTVGTFFIDKLALDGDKAKLLAEFQATAMKATADVNLGNIGVNKVEAAHRSVFVAGWRPAVGWCCAIGVAWNAIGVIIAQIAVDLATNLSYTVPKADSSILLPLITGMLGIAGMRSFEKMKQVAK